MDCIFFCPQSLYYRYNKTTTKSIAQLSYMICKKLIITIIQYPWVKYFILRTKFKLFLKFSIFESISLTSIILNILEKRKYAYYPSWSINSSFSFYKALLLFLFYNHSTVKPNTHDSTRQFTKEIPLPSWQQPEKILMTTWDPP
jgi:hypothetical protein